jgi:hypothetical protein
MGEYLKDGNFRRKFKSGKSGREYKNLNYLRETKAGKSGRISEGWESYKEGN